MIEYRVAPKLENEALNSLFSAAWGSLSDNDFQPVLKHSLSYVGAFAEERLIGFVNLAWDGGVHAFLLDTTVHPAWQRRGIGQKLVRLALRIAKEQGMIWVHVDFEPHLKKFYEGCGFCPTEAGLYSCITE